VLCSLKNRKSGTKIRSLNLTLYSSTVPYFSFGNQSPKKVRAEGLEPPCLSAPDPKSGTSTNFATPAGLLLYQKRIVKSLQVPKSSVAIRTVGRFFVILIFSNTKACRPNPNNVLSKRRAKVKRFDKKERTPPKQKQLTSRKQILSLKNVVLILSNIFKNR